MLPFNVPFSDSTVVLRSVGVSSSPFEQPWIYGHVLSRATEPFHKGAAEDPGAAAQLLLENPRLGLGCRFRGYLESQVKQ